MRTYKVFFLYLRDLMLYVFDLFCCKITVINNHKITLYVCRKIEILHILIVMPFFFGYGIFNNSKLTSQFKVKTNSNYKYLKAKSIVYHAYANQLIKCRILRLLNQSSQPHFYIIEKFKVLVLLLDFLLTSNRLIFADKKTQIVH